eukprot:6789457-Alexandrium_andersonii.AAC.1
MILSAAPGGAGRSVAPPAAASGSWGLPMSLEFGPGRRRLRAFGTLGPQLPIAGCRASASLSLIHISEPTRLALI